MSFGEKIFRGFRYMLGSEQEENHTVSFLALWQFLATCFKGNKIQNVEVIQDFVLTLARNNHLFYKIYCNNPTYFSNQ